MITFDEFVNYIEIIQEFDKFVSDLSDFGIDLYETKLPNLFYKMQCKYEKVVFTESQTDWISWWLYERPGMSDDEVTDKNGNIIPSKTLEDLWNIINNKEL